MQDDILPSIVDADGSAALGAPRALPDAPPLDFVIALWLSEQRSPRTRSEYAVTLADYRAHLAQVTLDLDSGDHHRLASVALAWSLRPTRQRGREGAPPSSSITARRMAIVSSFYQCAIRHGLHETKRVRDYKTGKLTDATYQGEVESNPLRYLKRPRVQRYAEAQPIDARELIARLRRIDRTTLAGKRDYALLSTALTTGRRIAELQSMTRGSLRFGRDRRIIVRWPTKGDKVMRDRLGDKTSAALLDYLREAYATDDPAALPPRTPIWRDCSRPAQWRREQRALATLPTQQQHQQQQRGNNPEGLSTSGIRRIFARWLGTSKAHVSRHSFGPLMEQVGASLTDIQARLGHASAKTTAEYMNAEKSADNPFVDRLEVLLGLE